MDQHTILQRLTQILRDVYDVNVDGVTPESTLKEIGIDSMISADLMIEIEDALSMSFTDMDLPRDASVQDIVNLIQANLAGSRQG